MSFSAVWHTSGYPTGPLAAEDSYGHTVCGRILDRRRGGRLYCEAPGCSYCPPDGEVLLFDPLEEI